MTLPDLFIKKERSFVKEASYRLGTSIDTWEQDIMEKLHEEHPYLPDYDIKVKIRKSDEHSGSGVGQLTVDDKIRIPIIIRNFKLEPLDIMYYGDQLLPISKASIENITHSGDLGKTTKPLPTGGDMGLRAATRAPHYGKYAYASSLEYTKEELADALSGAYDTQDGLTYDVSSNGALRRTVAQYVSNSGIEKVAHVADTPKPKIKLLKEANLKNLEIGGMRTLGSEGTLFKVANLNGSLNDRKMYIGTDGKHCFRDTMPGVEAQVKIASCEPKGEGVFFIVSNGVPICTEPLKVLYKTAEYTAVETRMGQTMRVFQIPGISEWEKVAKSLYLSDEWAWTPLKGKVQFSSAEQINKLAALGADFMVRKIGNYYLVEGDTSNLPEIDKIANSPITYEILHKGFTAYCSPEEVEGVRKEADVAIAAKMKTYVFDEEKNDMVELPKIASADMRAFIKTAGILTDDIIKQAGITADDADKTVDSLLGLNFLNDQNISRIIESIEDLEVARAILARMLLAGRMGLDIDVNVVKTAVFALDAVIKDLRRFKQVQLAK